MSDTCNSAIMGISDVVMFQFSEVVDSYIFVGSLGILHRVVDCVVFLIVEMVIALCRETPFIYVVHCFGLRVETKEIHIVSETKGEVVLTA
jgi:hypothetical protein